MTRTTIRRTVRAGAAVVALSVGLGLSTAAQADHVAEIAATDGSLVANRCVVGEESFSIPGQASSFGTRLETNDVKQEVVKGDRTLSYSCKFSDVPTTVLAYDPEGPEVQPGTSSGLTEDYTVPKGGFTASITCWDRFNEGMVEAAGTIQVSHRGTATLRCDLRAAYEEFDANG